MLTIKRVSLVLVSLTLAFPAAVFAQKTDYPTKPLTWIVGYPPGGGIDFLARTVGRKMSDQLGQPVVVENRAGAAGIVGASAIARATPDGYTFGSLGNGELVFNQMLYKKLIYNPQSEFISVGPVAKIPFLLAVNSSLPVKSVKELVSYAKKNQLQYASGGIGHPNHLMMELFKAKGNFDIGNIPYKGMAPALQDFLSGQVPVMFIDLATAVAQLNTGRFRILATTTKERLDALPDVPTMIEAGIPDFDIYAWQAIAVPAGTPHTTVDRLNRALQASLRDPEVQAAFKKAGMQPMPGGTGFLDRLIATDRKYWTPVIKSLHIQLD